MTDNTRPVITDEMVERAARAHYIAIWGDDLDPGVAMPHEALKSMRIALEAAFGENHQSPKPWDGSVPDDDYGPWGGTEGCFGHCDPEGWYSKCRQSTEQKENQ